MTDHEEYKTRDNQTVSIQHNPAKNTWEVACWNEDESNHWYFEYDDEAEARKEFNRWK